MESLWNDFLAPYNSISFHLIFLEIVAVFFGLISVLLAKKGNIGVYPTGIISTLIFVYLLWKNQLLGDMLINVYYTLMSIYGWYIWQKKKTKNSFFKVEKATINDWIFCGTIGIFSILFVSLVYYTKHLKNNALTWDIFLNFTIFDVIDIHTTALFLMGMVLMAKQKLENWIIWIIADIISVPLYFYKTLYFSSLQFLIFTIIAILGYIEWRKNYQKYKLS